MKLIAEEQFQHTFERLPLHLPHKISRHNHRLQNPIKILWTFTATNSYPRQPTSSNKESTEAPEEKEHRTRKSYKPSSSLPLPKTKVLLGPSGTTMPIARITRADVI